MKIYPSVSDKAIQAAVDEYKGAISDDLGDWHAMRIAIQAAMAEESKGCDISEDTEYLKFITNAYIVTSFAVIFLLMGIIVKMII